MPETQEKEPSSFIPPDEQEYADYEFAGITLQLPANAKQEDINTAIKGFMATPDFDRLIDKKSGAPAYVRGIVGSVYKQEDKLATLQKYYPDAAPYGENYVFTNPNTGRPTLYNPKGLDIGDVASVAREGTVMAGSALGATAGALTALTAGQAGPQIATPEELVTVPMAASIGSGVGAGVTGNAYDALLTMFGLKVDTRPQQQVIMESAVESGGAAVGEAFGRQIGPAIKQAIGGGTKRAQQLANLFRSLDIEPSATVVTGGRGLGRVEAALSQTAAGGKIIDDQAEKIVSQTAKATEKIVREIGEPKTAQGAGEAIKQAAKKAAERFGVRQSELYDEAFDLVGTDTKVSLESVKSLLVQMKSELAKAPKSPTLQKSLGPAIRELEGIIDTERVTKSIIDTGIIDDLGRPITKETVKGGGGFQFNALRGIRSRIGEEIGDPLTRSLQKTSMARVYAVLSQDMGATAASVSDDAAKKVAVADRYTRLWSNTTAKTVEKILKFDADEKAYRFALAASRDGGSSLNRLRRAFTPEEWDTVAATVLDRLGDATPGMQNAAGDAFSINTFLTNWNKMAPEAKDALFGGARYKSQREALNMLTDLMSKMKDVKRFANTSNTAGAMHTLLALNALGAAGGAIATGDVEGGGLGLATTVTGTILAPRAAAKLLTNPQFVKWLAEPVEQGISSAGAHIGRLVAIGKANPEIKEEIDQFLKQLELNTK